MYIDNCSQETHLADISIRCSNPPQGEMCDYVLHSIAHLFIVGEVVEHWYEVFFHILWLNHPHKFLYINMYNAQLMHTK